MCPLFWNIRPVSFYTFCNIQFTLNSDIKFSSCKTLNITCTGNFIFSSAWIKPENIYDYIQNKSKFCSKNRSNDFLIAIEEAEEAVNEANEQLEQPSTTVQHDSQNMAAVINSPSINVRNITVKTMDVKDLLRTFEENEATLRSIFNERRTKLDRFNYGMGYDFLTVLSRIATPEQQKKMFSCICEAFAGKEYYKHPIYENLFWSILLPEWLIAICMEKFSCSKKKIIEQLQKDEQNSLDSLDLSLDL